MMQLNRQAYQKLVDEDLEWLSKQPRTLEREHIEIIVRNSVRAYYGDETEHPTDRILADIRRDKRPLVDAQGKGLK